MNINKVKVNIYGKEYTIQGDAPSDYILKLAEYINDKMEEVNQSFTNANHVQIAILAALNIADEYFQLRDMNSGMHGLLEQKTRALISMLDEGIIGDVLGRIDSLPKQ